MYLVVTERKNMQIVYFYFTLLILFGGYSACRSDFPVCYKCNNISNPSECKDVFICQPGMRCHTIKIQDDHGTYYNLGCESRQTCAMVSSIVFGKRETRVNQKHMLCGACCDGPLCNAALCVPQLNTTVTPTTKFTTPKTDSTTQESSTAPTTTTAAPTTITTKTTTGRATTTTTAAPTTITTKTTTGSAIVTSPIITGSSATCKDKSECSYLLQHFSVCNDLDTAMNMCPESCGYCTTTSMTTTPTTAKTTTPTTVMTTKPCLDQSDTCDYLNSHLHICDDLNAALKFGCFKTCNMCGGMHTSMPTTVMTTKPCLDQGDTCGYLNSHLHICDDLNAVLKFGCFKTCNMCGGAPPTTVKATDPEHVVSATSSIQHTCSKGSSFHVMFISNQYVGSGEAELLIAASHSGQAHVVTPFLNSNITKDFLNFSEIHVAGSVQQNPQVIEKKGIHLYTSSEISLYALNTDSYSTDGFLAIADECLGSEYTASTYIDPSSTGKDVSVFLSVMAMGDTTVRFEIKLPYHSDNVTFNGKQYRNGDTIVTSLTQYETMELKSKYGLTGTRVTSSKNIAFTTGSDCAIVGGGSCSHMETMYPPNRMLADKYIIPTVAGRAASILRVVSTSNETVHMNATFSGRNLQKEIPAYEYVDFLVDADMPVHFSCSDKVLVTLYVEGRSDYTGDPFSMFVPGYRQYLSEYNFITPDDGFKSHITVIIPKIDISGLLLDGLLFTSKNRTNSDINVEGVVYSVSSVSVTPGYHSMKHDNGKTFGVFIYGNGPSDGYGYTAGFSSL